MGIEFDDRRVDVRGVDDRRGAGISGSAVGVGGGLGVVGVIVVLVIQLLGGPDLSSTLPSLTGAGGQGAQGAGGGSSGETSAQLAARCNTDGALQEYTDCRLIKVYDVADQVWAAEFARKGWDYSRPQLTFFAGSADTGCGAASSAVGPFYCPGDQHIYIDLNFLDELQARFGAQGEFAQAYILAHEYGHHLQSLLGIEQRVRAQQERDPSQANRLSVRMELQADCLAGAWATLADQSATGGIALTDANIAEAVTAAQAVGDDRIQQSTQGRVDPESWTHGSAAQRRQWFLTGYRAGTVEACNTFA